MVAKKINAAAVVLICAGAFLFVDAFFLLPETANERLTRTQIPLSLQDFFKLKRSYFFGHKEMSDIADGLSIIAATIDIEQNSKDPLLRESKVRARFEDSLGKIQTLAPFAIGMNDMYLLPAFYLCFEDQDPLKGSQIIEYGLMDGRTSVKVPLLGAFTAHIFLRDAQKAGAIYENMYKKYKTPEWVHDLAQKLLSGEDPYDTNPSIRQRIHQLLNIAFPKAKSFFEQNEMRRLEKLKNKGGTP